MCYALCFLSAFILVVYGQQYASRPSSDQKPKDSEILDFWRTETEPLDYFPLSLLIKRRRRSVTSSPLATSQQRPTSSKSSVPLPVENAGSVAVGSSQQTRSANGPALPAQSTNAPDSDPQNPTSANSSAVSSVRLSAQTRSSSNGSLDLSEQNRSNHSSALQVRASNASEAESRGNKWGNVRSPKASTSISEPARKNNENKHDEDDHEDDNEDGSDGITSKYLPDDCGATRLDGKKPSYRIIQGDVAELGQFPWIVRLGNIPPKNKQPVFFCGGSLINKFYVLSAAHCEDDATIVRVGENDVLTEEDCDSTGQCAPPHKDIKIKAYYFNDYCESTDENDISLIELQTAATFNDYVQPICLPSKRLTYSILKKQTASLAGWGGINAAATKVSDNLMFITAPVVDREKCERAFGDLFDTQLCIGYDKGKDSCGGDSGGPVSMSKKKNNKLRAHLVGIVSFGNERCGTGPAVYTDVSAYLDWIVKTVKKG